MSPQWSMRRIAFSEADPFRRPAKGTGRCLLGCDPSDTSSASVSRPYGAGLLRFMQSAGVEVLEVTTPDKHDRRRRGKNDELDAQNAAHAAFAGRRTVTPKTQDGMIESLRVLKACRKTAVAARRIALQMIQNTIVCAPDEVRETLRHMTRMQLVRTLAAWRPDLTDFRNVASAYRITLKSLGRRYLELHDEIADLDVMIGAIVDELAPDLVARNSIGHGAAAQLLLTAGDNSERLQRALPPCVASVRSPRPPARRPVIVSTEGVIGRQTARCTSSPWDGGSENQSLHGQADRHSKLEVIRVLKRYIARSP